MKQYTSQQIKLITESFQKGQKAIQTADFSKAEKHYLDILKIDSEIIDAKNALAYVYAISKQYTKAIKQLNHILASNPNDASVLHNLANVLSDAGSNDEAISHYRTAIKLNPTFIDSYTQCGLAYIKLKQYDLALGILKQAFNLDKFNAKNLYSFGITYAAMGDYTHAIEYLVKAVNLAPDNMDFSLRLAKTLEDADLVHEADIQYHQTCNKFPLFLDAFLAYGDLLSKNRYFDEALECFKHANSIAPTNIEIHDDIAKVYLGMADTDQAIKHFTYALSKQSNRLSSLVGLEQSYQESGNVDLASAVCDRIISLDASKPDGYILKSKIQKNKLEDKLSEKLLMFAENIEIKTDSSIDIHFALGKIFDEQNQYQLSFNHYKIANDLKNQSLNFKLNETKAKFDKLINVYDTDFFKRHQNLGVESQLPIIIVGMPRSATTLTEQIISSHPEVFAAGEVLYWNEVNYSMRYKLNSNKDYPECINDEKISADYIKEIANKYETTLAKISGAKLRPKHITDKMPHNFLNVGLIALAFPNVKIIHTKRDPIDTCLSIFFQNFNVTHDYAFNLENIGHYYNQYLRLMNHWHQVLPDRILDINYADTVAKPEYWSRKLISHIGLDWHDSCLAPHKLERSVKTASHWQVRQPIYKSSVQRWKNYEEFIQPLIKILNVVK
jgi:tetratricopeptide (TPR) repeat protein